VIVDLRYRYGGTSGVRAEPHPLDGAVLVAGRPHADLESSITATLAFGHPVLVLKTPLTSVLIGRLQGVFDPPRLLHMGPQHRQGPVCPAQHSRILHGLHGFLELIHLILLIPQNVLHILAIERMPRQGREFLQFLFVFAAYL